MIRRLEFITTLKERCQVQIWVTLSVIAVISTNVDHVSNVSWSNLYQFICMFICLLCFFVLKYRFNLRICSPKQPNKLTPPALVVAQHAPRTELQHQNHRGNIAFPRPVVELFEHHQLVGTESRCDPAPKKHEVLSVTSSLRAFVKFWFVAPHCLRVSCPFATKHLGWLTNIHLIFPLEGWFHDLETGIQSFAPKTMGLRTPKNPAISWSDFTEKTFVSQWKKIQ